MNHPKAPSFFHVRHAFAKDADLIVAFNQAMALETEGRALKDQVIRAGVQRIFDEPAHGFYLVAETAEETIATLMVTSEWSDWRNGQFWWIQSVYVKSDYRRRGVYRDMYLFVKKLASSQKDICGFRLYVEKDNLIAQKTYRTLDMEETPYLLFEEELSTNS